MWKLCKGTVSAYLCISVYRIARIYAETAFPQNLHTRKLGEVTVFYAVFIKRKLDIEWNMVVILLIKNYNDLLDISWSSTGSSEEDYREKRSEDGKYTPDWL